METIDAIMRTKNTKPYLRLSFTHPLASFQKSLPAIFQHTKFTFACLLVCLLVSFRSISQTSQPVEGKYWIQFTDKDSSNYDPHKHLSPRAIQNRLRLGIPLSQPTDIPLTQSYLQRVAGQNIQKISTSKWLNAISANLTADQIKWLQQQDFIKQVILIQADFQPLANDDWYNEQSYATAIAQMEPGAFEVEKLTGKDVVIGVIDAGFYGAHKRKSLSGIFMNNQVLGVRDFVTPSQTDLFTNSYTSSDSHGTRVLEMIAGERFSNSRKYGFATEASFYLARTDDGNHEFRGEEDYWIAAMEWMDSLGVRIINTSLGYALGFDNPEENYRPDNMDGKTAMISKAATIAVNEKGLLLVVSAGNEGADPSWRIVSAPADVEGAISVGATNSMGGKAGYSSIGPVSLPYLKPNISCYSGDGTSFSAPVITGFAACLMQKDPYATNKQIAKIIEESGHLFPYGNNYIGYGIPKSTKAINLMNGKFVKSILSPVDAKAKEEVILKLPKNLDENHAIAFHKQDKKTVYRQSWVRISRDRIKLKKPKKATTTTVIVSDKIGFEVIWE